MSSSQIGFYTEKTASSIPSKPGIYAWFLPIDVKQNIAKDLKRCKSYFSYDSRIKDGFKINGSTEFQWTKFDYEARATEEYRTQKTLEDRWHCMASSFSEDDFKALRQTINLTSIFSKPLYVGLTKNLSGRYEQHVIGGRGNNFHNRFTDFAKSRSLKVDVGQLIFCCIPFDRFGSSGEGFMDEDAIKVLEYIVKNIVGPVFGEV